jgi:hypothetical protein
MEIKTNVKAILDELKNISIENVLYEAITNSIQANADNIEINLISETLDIEKDKKYISSIEIKDNGDGFTKENLSSFQEYKSDHKKELGSKGIGRFTYLKLFSQIEITSLDKKIEFSQNGLSIQDDSESPNETKITFRFPKENIYIQLNKLKNKIEEHFLPYFKLLERDITISLKLEDTVEKILSSQIPKFITEKFKIKNHLFNINYSFESESFKAYYCAGNRVVKENRQLYYEKKLHGFDNEKLIFLLSSKYFDETVNDNRDDFNIYPKEKKQKEMFRDLSWEDIHTSLNLKLQDILFKNAVDIQKKKKEELSNSIKEAPFLANYINSDEFFLPSEELIKKAKKQLEDDKRFLRNDKNSNKLDFSQKLNKVTQSELAEYIFDREKVIKQLEKLSGKRDTLEKEIHNLFMKQKTEDNTGNYKTNNLWLFDDRFMSYDKVFSDKHIQDIFPELSKNLKRPDILSIVSNTYVKEQITDIVIIELKRADEKITPAIAEEELLRYSRYMGEANLRNRVRVWSYAFLKFDEETENDLEDKDYNKILSNSKYPIYYKYHSKRNTIINFLDYEALISDAKARNKTFIDILKGKFI